MHFPTGFIGNPHNVPACSLTEFSLHECSPDSQVGVTEILGTLRQAAVQPGAPCRRGGPGRLLHPGSRNTSLHRSPRPHRVRLRARRDQLSPSTTFCRSPTIEVHIWGVPADPSHDANRFPPGQNGRGGMQTVPGGLLRLGGIHLPARALPSEPDYLRRAAEASHSIEYYTGTVVRAIDDWPATTGCDQLTFNPSLTATPTTGAADSASGLDVTLRVPQTQSPTAPSPSEIRERDDDASRRLFPCAQRGQRQGRLRRRRNSRSNTEEAAHCPEFAKIGTSTHRQLGAARPDPGQHLHRPAPARARPTASSSPPTASPPT